MDMTDYIIKDKPVAVRSEASPEAAIINALKPGKVITVISEHNGWLRLITDGYILKSEYVITLEEYNKTTQLDSNKVQNRRMLFNNNTRSTPEPEALKIGSHCIIKNKGTKDLRTGNIIDEEFTYESAILVVEKIDGSEVTIYNMDTNSNKQTFVVNIDDLRVMSSEGKHYTGVDYEATREEQNKNVLDNIKDIVSKTAEELAKLEQLDIKSTRSIFGMPYQFLPIADNRLDESFNNGSFGRKYYQKIVTRTPLLVMQAGIPDFLQGYSEESAATIGKAMSSLFNGDLGDTGNKSSLDKLLNSSGKYYALKVTPEEYYDTVTPVCRAMATLLNLNDKIVTIGDESSRLAEFNWRVASQKPLFGYYKGAVCFYINSEAQVTESFSNGTTQSQLASKMNNIGQLGSELQFLLGGATNVSGWDMTQLGQQSLTTGEFRNAGGMVNTLLTNIQTLIAGGRMIFPEIWADSMFTRSYNVTIKLDSPDCDPLSIYLNILAPLAHILGFVQPRSVGTNSYISPFLVRAYYKSMFHIDMGLVTECNIQKGDVGAWTQDGLPTQITVQLTIKDLYNVLSLALNNGIIDLVGNPAQLDYIANLCGVNIAEPDMIRTLKLWSVVRGVQRIEDNLVNGWSSLMTGCYRRWNNLFDKNWTM